MQYKPRVNQYAIRRVEFDQWLLNRSGARILRHTVREARREGDAYVIDNQFMARYLVGAGGTHCPVRRAFFDADAPRRKEDLIIALEDEIKVQTQDRTCHLWFLREKLPGYAWYVPKADGFVNIGVGGKFLTLKERGVDIRFYWQRLQAWLDMAGLPHEVDLQPKGLQYYLRGRRPPLRIGNAFLTGDAAGLATRDMGEGIRAAVLSGIDAAKAITEGSHYSVNHIPSYSFPSLLFA